MPLYDTWEQFIHICTGHLERVGMSKSDLWRIKTGKLWLHFSQELDLDVKSKICKQSRERIFYYLRSTLVQPFLKERFPELIQLTNIVKGVPKKLQKFRNLFVVVVDVTCTKHFLKTKFNVYYFEGNVLILKFRIHIKVLHFLPSSNNQIQHVNVSSGL